MASRAARSSIRRMPPLAVSEYSIPVTGVVRAGRVYGAQFHPEKSGDTGLRILRAFAEL